MRRKAKGKRQRASGVIPLALCLLLFSLPNPEQSVTLLDFSGKTPFPAVPDTNTFTFECPTERAVLHALLYFEIFSHPLTEEEVYQFSNSPEESRESVFEKLHNLVEQGLVFRFGSFYQTRNDPQWAERRLEYNHRAEALMPVARRMARFIGNFPFIRAVLVSGSLSKHCMKADSDIDFFLVTQPGRLWLTRTLLVIFKKIFLFNSHKYFCVNYFVDTDHLEIEEKNLFTAVETATLLPLYGREWCQAFGNANGWVRRYLPHFQPRPLENTPRHRRGFFKRPAEWLLGTPPGHWLDAVAMRSTVAYWRRKFRHFDDRTFDTALRSRRYVSKHHPLYFQKTILEKYARRLAEFGPGD